MKFAVLGDQGLFGSDMAAFLRQQEASVQGFNRSNLDLSQSTKMLAEKFGDFDVVVNSVAFTAVDQAETETEQAHLINGEYAGKLAAAAAMSGSKFIQISTDYVFAGDGDTPISLNQKNSPFTAYGKSKALGEELVAISGADFVIVRTAWLYGSSGKCFPRTIAQKMVKGDPVNVVVDQFGQPTWTLDVAEVVYAHSVNNYSEKIVHAVSSGQASWFDFASEVSRSMGDRSISIVRPVQSSAFPAIARRPLYSVLENTQTAGPVIGNWSDRWAKAAPEILRSVE